MIYPNEFGYATYGSGIPALFHYVRLDVPMTSLNALHEAKHVSYLYEIYASQYNRMPNIYNDDHLDVLHRRIAHAPDVEVQDFLDGRYHAVSWNTGHALRNAFLQARIKLGEAVQPLGWNRSNPWGNYDFRSKLEQEGFPYLPEPEGVAGDLALTGWFGDYAEMCAHVARLQFWTICITTIADIYRAYLSRDGHNIMYAHYTHSSPALFAAHRFYSRVMGQDIQPQSMDIFSCDGMSPKLNRHDSIANRLEGFSDSSSEEGMPRLLEGWANPANTPSPPSSPPQDEPFDAVRWASQSPDSPVLGPTVTLGSQPQEPVKLFIVSLPRMTPDEWITQTEPYDWARMLASPPQSPVLSYTCSSTASTSDDGTLSSFGSWGLDSDVPSNWTGVPGLVERWHQAGHHSAQGRISWDSPQFQVDRDHWTLNQVTATLEEFAVAQLAEAAAN